MPLRSRWVSLLLLWVPGLLSASQVTETAVPGSHLPSQLGQLVLGLGLVIVLIFVLAWVARRVQNMTPRGGQVIQLLATQSLGPRDRLLLVQVGNEQVLLGLSAGRIAPLHVLKEPIDVAANQARTPEFAQRLMELLSKEPRDSN